MIINRTVLGEPKAQARHRHFQRGKFSQTYDPSSTLKESFAAILQREAPELPIDEPIALELNFYMHRPKNHYRTGAKSGILKDNAPEWHKSKPDIDNLCKFVQDALNKIYYRDDSLICQLVSKKQYSEKPRTEISIITL